MYRCILFILLSCSLNAWAGDVEIVKVVLTQKTIDTWQANVTLKHADAGWKHYADAWRVILPGGKVLGLRTLYHPHVEEQPFTRSLSSFNISRGVEKVFVEAHDKVHGWAKQKVEVNLMKASGKRFTVHRK